MSKLGPFTGIVLPPRPPAWAVLGLLLAVSLWFNLWQAKREWIEEATAPLQDEIDALTASARMNDTIADLRARHDVELAAARNNVQVVEGERQVVYRDRLVQLPAPTCAPGAARVDAWNAPFLPGAKP